MRSSTLLAFATCSVPLAAAFPTRADPHNATVDFARQRPIKRALTYKNPYPTHVEGLGKVPDKDHPFIAPVEGDQRGACPGLNVLANHGYIPRNGIVTLTDLLRGMKDAFNIDEGLTTALAAIAIVLTGDPTTQTVSIGGPDARVGSNGYVSGTAQTVFGPARGSNAHNSFEGDGSLTRADYYLNNGDNFSFQSSAYKQLSDLAARNGDDFGLPTTHEAHYQRWLYSKKNNPGWYNMPPTAILTTGATSFIARCYANGTYGDDGVTNAANVDPFFGAVATDTGRTSFRYVPEQFPAKWFRSGVGYGLRQVTEDILETYSLHPEMLEFGGNAGHTNNFVPLGITAPTDVNGFGCFIYNSQLAYLPNQLADASVEGIAFAITTLDALIGPHFQKEFGCKPYVRDATREGIFKNITQVLQAGILSAGVATPRI